MYPAVPANFFASNSKRFALSMRLQSGMPIYMDKKLLHNIFLSKQTYVVTCVSTIYSAIMHERVHLHDEQAASPLSLLKIVSGKTISAP